MLARSRVLATILLAGSSGATAGCAAVIQYPPAVSGGQPSHVPTPVDIKLDWSSKTQRTGKPGVWLDGADVTADFEPDISTSEKAHHSYQLAGGQHQVSVSVPQTATLGTYNESLPFIVDAPNFSLSVVPSSLALPINAAGTAAVSITNVFNFAGSVQLSVTGLPAGVTATPPASGTTSPQTIAFTAGPTATPGTSTITITGTCTANCQGATTATTTLALTVVGPGIGVGSVTPTGDLIVPRAGSAPVTVNVQRTGGFTGSITMSATGLSGGVSAAPVMIPGGSTSGQVTFVATAAAGLDDIAGGIIPAVQTATLTLSATCTPACANATTTVRVRIGRRLGALVITPPTLSNAPSSATSADGASTLQYTVANPQPPNQTLFTATFRRVPSTTQIAAIDLAQSHTLSWGAGFCTGSPTNAGVVLSNTWASQTSAPLFFTLPIWKLTGTATARLVTIDVFPTMPGGSGSVAPTLWYSPDCTIAASVNATAVAATPSALSLIDMRTGLPLATQMAYSGGLPSTIEVVSTTSGQAVRVTFSPTDIRTINLP